MNTPNEVSFIRLPALAQPMAVMYAIATLGDVNEHVYLSDVFEALGVPDNQRPNYRGLLNTCVDQMAALGLVEKRPGADMLCRMLIRGRIVSQKMLAAAMDDIVRRVENGTRPTFGVSEALRSVTTAP